MSYEVKGDPWKGGPCPYCSKFALSFNVYTKVFSCTSAHTWELGVAPFIHVPLPTSTRNIKLDLDDIDDSDFLDLGDAEDYTKTIELDTGS